MTSVTSRVPPNGVFVIDRSLTWMGENLTAIDDNQFPGNVPAGEYGHQSQSFAYTPTHRLQSAKGYYGDLSWTYDSVGNRATKTENGVTSTYAYPAMSNRLSSVTPAGGTARAFGYDASGNITNDSAANVASASVAMTYAYDKEGRLSTATQTAVPAETSAYFYDSRNRLVARVLSHASGPKTTILYFYDIDDHLIAETDEYGASQREYIWIGDTPVAVIDSVSTAWPQTYSVHVDHLMRPARLTDAAGTWVWDVIYKPFGETAFLYANPVVFHARFPGQWFQLETGLAYNWNRHYDASIGRYNRTDPIGLSALMQEGPSLYGYARQNPLYYIDLNAAAATGARIGGAIGGVVGSRLGSATLGRSIGAVVGSAIEDICRRDDCQELYARIADRLNELKKRYSDLIRDEGKLPLTGEKSIEGHRQQFMNKQQSLRNMLNEADERRCFGYPPDAWNWATKEAPYPKWGGSK